MKKALFLLLACTVLCILSTAAIADMEGDFEYYTTGGQVNIAQYMGNETNLVIPSSIGGMPVTNIHTLCSTNNQTIQTITIPKTVTKLVDNPFCRCEALQAILVEEGNPVFVSVDGVLFSKEDKKLCCYPRGKAEGPYEIHDGIELIGDEAFYSCLNLTQVSIPNSVTMIGGGAFFNCQNLTGVVFGDGASAFSSLTEIKHQAFDNCNSLAAIEIPDSVQIIGEQAFSACDSLIEITLPHGITKISEWTFSRCGKLTTVILPDTVTDIKEYAFSSCSALESITIPDSVERIGNEAFHNCDSLKEVHLPNSVTSLGDGTFSDCDNLEAVTVDDDHPAFTTVDSVLFSKDGKTLIFYPPKLTAAAYEIPDGVTSIAPYAFNCASFTQVAIPDTVTSIGERAFLECRKLAAIEIPDSVTEIGMGAFRYCLHAERLVLSKNLQEIDEFVFFQCQTLTEVTIPDGVTSIGNQSFACCHSLENIVVPASVTFIHSLAFDRCDSLSSMTVAEGSYAQTFCAEQGISAVIMEEEAAQPEEDAWAWLNP